MRDILLLAIILLFTSCSSSPDLPSSRDNNTNDKILANKSEAITAQDEYRKLQAQREKA